MILYIFVTCLTTIYYMHDKAFMREACLASLLQSQHEILKRRLGEYNVRKTEEMIAAFSRATKGSVKVSWCLESKV